MSFFIIISSGMTYSSPNGTISYDGTVEIGVAFIGSSEEHGKVLIFFAAQGSAVGDAFLFFVASFSTAFVFFTSDAESSVTFFTLQILQ